MDLFIMPRLVQIPSELEKFNLIPYRKVSMKTTDAVVYFQYSKYPHQGYNRDKVSLGIKNYFYV